MNKKGQKNFVLGLLVIGAIAVLFVISAMWFGIGELKNSQGEIIEVTLPYKILITVGGLAILIIGYLLFHHQKRSDKRREPKSFGEEVLSTGYKVHGFGLRVKAIFIFILGGILFILGIVLAITVAFSAIFLSVIGLLLLIGGWLYWKRAKSLARGRFY